MRGELYLTRAMPHNDHKCNLTRAQGEATYFAQSSQATPFIVAYHARCIRLMTGIIDALSEENIVVNFVLAAILFLLRVVLELAFLQVPKVRTNKIGIVTKLQC